MVCIEKELVIIIDLGPIIKLDAILVQDTLERLVELLLRREHAINAHGQWRLDYDKTDVVLLQVARQVFELSQVALKGRLVNLLWIQIIETLLINLFYRTISRVEFCLFVVVHVRREPVGVVDF